MNTAHDPEARAAAVGAVDYADLPAAVAGRKAHDPETGETVWLPVRGPHLRAIRRQHARNRTGVPGISFGVNRFRRKDGTYRVRNYFFAQIERGGSRKFCIETLGRAEAWRRALKCRAAFEMKINRANALILAARERNEYGN